MAGLPLNMPTATNTGIDPMSAQAPIGVPAQLHRKGHAGKMHAHAKGGRKKGRAYRSGQGRGHSALKRG